MIRRSFPKGDPPTTTTTRIMLNWSLLWKKCWKEASAGVKTGVIAPLTDVADIVIDRLTAFCRLQFNPETIELRLRELAYLNSAATVSFRALSAAASEAPDWTQFHFKGGIKEYVAWVNREKPIMHDPIFVSKKVHSKPQAAQTLSKFTLPLTLQNISLELAWHGYVQHSGRDDMFYTIKITQWPQSA